MKSKKVEIIITEGHNYDPSVKNGAPYISVDYSASLYGGASPCNCDDDINTAIKHAKDSIKNHGDIPVIIDKRKKAMLSNWF